MMPSEWKRITATLLAVLFVLGLAVPAAVAWFASVSQIDDAAITAGSIANYFAGGDGSESNPYLLTNANHVYNLTWLQNKGVFVEPKYFKLNADIDMSTLQVEGARSAVPPIGTTANPFTGYFDGQGHTVSNLWVSSDENDWKRKPETYTGDIGSDIGFFGAIAGNADVKNFYLKDVEVTTHVDGRVGLIAGTLDASMSQVGVVNGKITAKAAVSLDSQYSLIGKTESGVAWPDRPSNSAGGDLVIAPSGLKDTTTNTEYPKFTDNSSGVTPITTSAKDADDRYTAFFTGNLSATTAKNNLSKLYSYNGTVPSFPEANGNYNTATILQNNSTLLAGTTQMVNPTEQEKTELLIYNYFKNIDSCRLDSQYLYTIQPGTGKPFASLLSLTEKNGKTYQYPQNAICFKPIESGTCYVSFTKENNSQAHLYMSLYRYIRKADGTIDTDSVREIVFDFPKSKSNGISNGSAVIFAVDIEKTETDHYEYAIGRSSIDTNTESAKFFFLKLAGTDTTGGGSAGGTGKKLEKIDFLPAVPQTFPETVHLSSLEISGTSSAGQTFCFNAQDDGLVHYYTDGSAALVEKVTTNPESVREDSPASFPAIPSSG